MNPPPGRTKHKKPSGPRKMLVGYLVEFSWKRIAMDSLLKTYTGCDDQKMAAYLKTRPYLLSCMMIEEAPFKSKIKSCLALFPKNWNRQLNQLAAEEMNLSAAASCGLCERESMPLIGIKPDIS